MRSQRRAGQTIDLVHVTTTKDELGNETTATVVTTIKGAIFEPERAVERTGTDQAPVLQPAVWNLPGVHAADADDVIRQGATEWQVVGAGEVWRDRTKVPVQQPREV